MKGKPGPKKGQKTGKKGGIIGSAGGKVGGPARAKALTPARRSQIAADGGKSKANRGKGRKKTSGE